MPTSLLSFELIPDMKSCESMDIIDLANYVNRRYFKNLCDCSTSVEEKHSPI